MGSKIIRKQSNQSASDAQGGTSGIGGPLGEQIEGSCIGIGVGVSVAGIGLGMMVGFTPQGNGCSSTDLGIGSVDIVQVGCDVIVTKTLAGVVIETEHRTAKECKPPEPPKPPGPSPSGGKPVLDPDKFYHIVSYHKSAVTHNYRYDSWGDFIGIHYDETEYYEPYIEQRESDRKYQIKNIYRKRRTISYSWLTSPPTVYNYEPLNYEPYPYSPCTHSGSSLINPATGGRVTLTGLPGWERDAGKGIDLDWFYARPGQMEQLTGVQETIHLSDGRVWVISNVDKGFFVVPCEPEEKPPPNLFPPKKMSDCCNATTAMLRKIMKVLAVDEIEKNGIKIPKEFLAPGGTGQLKVTNYAELQLNLFRTVNRYGIDTPIRIKIKDVNKAKKGDQSVDVQFNSPAAAIQALVELAIENKGDAATRLQIQVRLIYAVTRTLKMVAGIGETIREVVKMLGSPFRWTTTRLPLEFDLSAGITNKSKSGKGFEKKPAAPESEDGLAPGLEANDEDTTESLLPAILTPSDYPLPVPRFVETEDDLQDLLVKVILLLGSKK